jgi:HD-like signal output (HDOD) protein/DNA-binding response OmpR family regulator
MKNSPYRALVVDDELAVRNLTIRALTSEGFCCQPAADGLQAQELAAVNRYDVVVTDLRMPNRHGHALASELLEREDRPLVVVLTGVLDPKLARDLVARGTDYVEFKPVQYELFAAKVAALAARRKQGGRADGGSVSPAAASDRNRWEGGQGADGFSLKLSDMERKLASLSKILPVSQAAFDVFNMASSDACEPQQIAAGIARDASLSVDVLRMANSAYYNPSLSKVVELREAVVRIGQKRIGELALATTALATLATSALPWMRVELAWWRSIAAGVAMDLLLADGTHSSVEEGLFLNAIIHPLGRIALGTLYPQQYQEMAKTCEKENLTLSEQERSAFSVTSEEVLTHLLSSWGIPSSLCEPVAYVAESYTALAALPEPLRTRAELVKLAVLLGWIAADDWEPWDHVEFPSASTARRLGLKTLPDILAEIRTDTQEIIGLRGKSAVANKTRKNSTHRPKPRAQLAYGNLSPETFDFLAEIVASMGIQLKATDLSGFEWDDNVLINCIWTPAHRVAAHALPQRDGASRLIVTDAENPKPYEKFGSVVSLPGCYAALRTACQQCACGRQATAVRT